MSFDELASEYDAIVKPKEVFEQKYKKKLPVVFGPITDKNVEQVSACIIFQHHSLKRALPGQ